ncbi:MAG: hypothetical protein EG824_04225 [Deltaproteobacteria bacterium]|nr:hypothetical protein [Deltaproteobacteria bacterium]
MDSKLPEFPSLLPGAAFGIDINFCKNPRCVNFAIPANEMRPKSRQTGRGNTQIYTIASSGKNLPNIRCSRCGQHSLLKSNKGAYEEYCRQSAYLQQNDKVSCPNNQCPNSKVDVAIGKSHYYAHGKTKTGSPRFRCKLCKATIAVPYNPTRKQRKTSFNNAVLEKLTNGMSLRRVIRTEKIKPATLYHRIDFLVEQARRFSANRERKLGGNLYLAAVEKCERRNQVFIERGAEPPAWNIPSTRLYISTDCMDHNTNWRCTRDKRNVQLRLIASAETTSGYVLAASLAYDPDLNPAEVEEDATECGDYQAKLPMRKYARLWLSGDYLDAATGNEEPVLESSDNLSAVAKDEVTTSTQFPLDGMQVRIDYAMLGHFLLLNHMLQGVDKMRFFLDTDPGMDSACMAVFNEEIRDKRCEVFSVKINKKCTNPQRLQYVNETRRELFDFSKSSIAYGDLKDYDLAIELMKGRIRQEKNIKNPAKRFVRHTLPKKCEPYKEVCWLTDLEDGCYDGKHEDHLARLYLKASLHAVDNFFQRLRRGVRLFERPIATPSSQRNMWYGYAPYNPKILTKTLDIYRAVYNYVEIGEDGKTPAMRLGLAKAPLEYGDIIRYE